MRKNNNKYLIDNIEFSVIYSARRSLGISVLPDSSVVIRVPYLTTAATIRRIVKERSEWIIKHRDNYLKNKPNRLNSLYIDGAKHLFRGREYQLKTVTSNRSFVVFNTDCIEVWLKNPSDSQAVKRILYTGYRSEAKTLFPSILQDQILKYEDQKFKPTGLVIRSMKRRWGSCSVKGVITLSTELIKLDDRYLEYVIVHELCHLKHHNHGSEYYKLLSCIYPEWKQVRKDLRNFNPY